MKKSFLVTATLAISHVVLPALAQTPVENDRLLGLLNSWSIESRTIIVSDQPYVLANGFRVVSEAGRNLTVSSLTADTRVRLTVEDNRVTVITVLR